MTILVHVLALLLGLSGMVGAALYGLATGDAFVAAPVSIASFTLASIAAHRLG